MLRRISYHVQPVEMSLSTSTILKNAPNATEPTMAMLTKALICKAFSSKNALNFALTDCARAPEWWGGEGSKEEAEKGKASHPRGTVQKRTQG